MLLTLKCWTCYVMSILNLNKNQLASCPQNKLSLHLKKKVDRNFYTVTTKYSGKFVSQVEVDSHKHLLKHINIILQVEANWFHFGLFCLTSNSYLSWCRPCCLGGTGTALSTSEHYNPTRWKAQPIPAQQFRKCTATQIFSSMYLFHILWY